MEALWNFKDRKKFILLWSVFILSPLLLNLFIWKSFVLPQSAKLHRAEEVKKMTVLRPQLEKLLSEFHRELGGWQKSVFTKEDPSAAMQAIQKLSTQNHVEIKQIRSKGTGDSPENPGYSQMTVELEVWGNFTRLLHWMNAVETQTGLEIDSWKIATTENPSEPPKLTVSMNVFLK